MEKETMGMMIAAKRKELGMTQRELAQQMGVTDKAVSKWERDLVLSGRKFTAQAGGDI